MNKKLLAPAALLAAVGLALSGCASSDAGGDTAGGLQIDVPDGDLGCGGAVGFDGDG